MKSLFVFIVFAAVAYADYFPTCKRSDPNLSKCILDAVEKLRPQIMKGISEIKLPALDTFHLPTLKLNKDLGDNLHVNIVIRKAEVRGANSFRIDDLKTKLNGNQVKIYLVTHINVMEVTATYELTEAKILTLNLPAGSGQFKGTFTDITTKTKVNAKIITENGHQYLNIEDVDVKITIGDGHVDIQDDNDKHNAGAQAATVFFNANPPAMLKELKPLIEEVTLTTVKRILNEVFHTLPFDELVQD